MTYKRIDKHKDFEIRLKKCHLLKLSKGVMQMAENDSDLLNAVCREISEKLGMDTAMEIYQMFKGLPVTYYFKARAVDINGTTGDYSSVKSIKSQ